ncbi:hypothetical protein D7Z54_34125 [Salibacterium salarium]|uniref:Uncharacterized protein n=1 Tax=Salibacterium salarium TaxID=284579 RepID=A0A3R9QM66_9BACI|nr:hypothetical protein [Salibacterium salarium]RSL28885.1 hypothetical protein D7Z54_34125 [Salibacterium salarium]
MTEKDVLNQILGIVQSLEQRLQLVETNMITKEEIASLPTRDEVNHLMKEETKSLATKESLKELATKESLKDLATKGMLEELATKVSLKDLATNEAVIATKSEIGTLQETMDRMETKQELIYNQTGKLSEYHTDLKVEFSDVKDRISFQTHKLSEAELELFKLKKSQ